jgi:hypothetical protein
MQDAYFALKAIRSTAGEETLDEQHCQQLIDALERFVEQIPPLPSRKGGGWLSSLVTVVWTGGTNDALEHRLGVVAYLKHALSQRQLQAEMLHGKGEYEEDDSDIGDDGRSGAISMQAESKVLPQIKGPARYDEETLRRMNSTTTTTTALSEGQWQQITQQAQQLQQRHADWTQELRGVEQSLSAITRLQHILHAELAWQAEQVTYLDVSSSTTEERVRRGNRFLEQAVRSQANAPLILAWLTLLFAVLLLLLHYSN